MGRLLRSLLTLCFTPAFAASCGVEQADSQTTVCEFGPDCVDAGLEPEVEDVADNDLAQPPAAAPAADASTAESAPVDAGRGGTLHPICQAPVCRLDDAFACRDPNTRNQLEVAKQLVQASGDAGTLRASSDAGASEPDTAGDPDEDAADASVAEPVGDAGPATEVVDDAVPPITADASDTVTFNSCQIELTEDSTLARCLPAGNGVAESACSSSRDCRPGLGCVGPPGAGQCLRFCCDGDASCGEGRFCDERQLRTPNAPEQDPLLVPVCAMAEMCDLSEPYPCPDGGMCTCEDGKTCTVVNPQGSTGCRTPGTGELDEGCPCAAGYFCHPIEQTCKQLCKLDANDGVCGEGICQATPDSPESWGLCQPLAPGGP